MAKVQISLVGGQPTPVYQGVVFSSPDRIILICSGQTMHKAEEIKEQLKALNYFNVQIETFSIEDTSSIRFKLNTLLGTLLPDDELSMNLSGGVKIWSLICLQLVSNWKAHIYCLSQNGKVLTICGEESTQSVQFDMFTQFALLGHPLEHYVKYAEYTDEDKRNHDTIAKIYTNGMFQKLLKKMQAELKQNKAFFKDSQSIEVDDDSNHYIDWNKDEQVFAISLGDSSDFYHEVSGPHAISMLSNTGWFEYEVASYFASLYGAENVYTNCVFKSEGGQDKNEVDIIANTGQKLIFVECKTDIKEITAIDKFASVVKNYGGNGSKSMFITLFPMNKLQQEKCRDNRIVDYYTHYNVKEANGKTKAHMISSKQFQQEIQSFISTANE